jgi:hypothetical protein
MTEQQQSAILSMYVKQFEKVETAYTATDKLLLSVLMGDVDPMQAMIDRMKIRDAYHEEA